MAKKNVLQEVKTRMAEMKEKKAAELDTIQKLRDSARADLEAAEAAIKNATEHMNIDAYEAAMAARQHARSAINMYDSRYKQIEKQEYISEAESDAVIDSLLAYEEELAEDFKAAAVAPVEALVRLYTEYADAVKDTENTITAWQRDIRANYNTRGQMHRTDQLTGEVTDRSETPYPVHRLPYTGCKEAAIMGACVEKLTAEFLKG